MVGVRAKVFKNCATYHLTEGGARRVKGRTSLLVSFGVCVSVMVIVVAALAAGALDRVVPELVCPASTFVDGLCPLLLVLDEDSPIVEL